MHGPKIVSDLAMYHNPLVYCTCWDPWGLGPRKLIKTPQPPSKTSWRRSKLTPVLPVSKEYNYLQPPPVTKPAVAPKVSVHSRRREKDCKLPHEVIDVLPGYQLVQSQEQVSVTLGNEMFYRERQLDPAISDRVNISRTNIICDLEEQISELTTIIEQMNRDHQAARKLLCSEMEHRCDDMERSFENKTRELKMAHKAELSELENNYREALKAEKSTAQGKLEKMQKEYKYLKNMFHMYQDTIHEEMEDKWSKQKAEWEEDEKMEREKILLQQKYKMTKKFELESEEEKRRMSESYSAAFESFVHEKEELLKQHERDTIQLQEMRKTKEIIEEELHAQALILESLNTNLYQTQLELQKEKAAVGNLEKMLQNKLAEVEEKYKYTIQNLTEENIHLRQKIIAKNEETYERPPEQSTSVTPCECGASMLEDGSNKTEES